MSNKVITRVPVRATAKAPTKVAPKLPLVVKPKVPTPKDTNENIRDPLPDPNNDFILDIGMEPVEDDKWVAKKTDKDDVVKIPHRRNYITVRIPEEYDSFLVEFKPDEYHKLIEDLKAYNVSEDILKRLKYSRALKGSYIFKFIPGEFE